MIRLATQADIPAILAVYAPYVENTTYTFEYDVPTLDAFTARFEAITAQFPWLVWVEDGKVLGYAYGSAPFERAAYGWCAEVSIYLAPEIQGIGIGRKLYVALEAFLKLQGYKIIFSLITAENSGSLAFHTRLGYSVCGNFPDCGLKFGRWLGVIWMKKELFSGEIPINTPVSAACIVKNHRNFVNNLDNIPLF
jgi:phosphinothricin acetyltransferase